MNLREETLLKELESHIAKGASREFLNKVWDRTIREISEQVFYYPDHLEIERLREELDFLITDDE